MSYSYFAALGLDIRLADATICGRIDMAVLLNEQVYLFECKVVELLPEGKALQQIRDRGYAAGAGRTDPPDRRGAQSREASCFWL